MKYSSRDVPANRPGKSPRPGKTSVFDALLERSAYYGYPCVQEWADTDLEMDRLTLTQHPGQPFLWILRRLGTVICILPGKSRKELWAALRTWKFYEDSYFDAHYYYSPDGASLREIGLEQSLEILKNYIAKEGESYGDG